MKADSGLMVAAQRLQTGAENHKVNNLLHTYVCACQIDNQTLANRARHELITLMREKELQRAAAATR